MLPQRNASFASSRATTPPPRHDLGAWWLLGVSGVKLVCDLFSYYDTEKSWTLVTIHVRVGSKRSAMPRRPQQANGPFTIPSGGGKSTLCRAPLAMAAYLSCSRACTCGGIERQPRLMVGTCVGGAGVAGLSAVTHLVDSARAQQARGGSPCPPGANTTRRGCTQSAQPRQGTAVSLVRLRFGFRRLRRARVDLIASLIYALRLGPFTFDLSRALAPHSSGGHLEREANFASWPREGAWASAERTQ